MIKKNIVARGSWMLLIPLVNLMYLPLDHNNGHVHCLVTALDKDIPFDKIFVIPYAAWYLFIFSIMVWYLFKDRELYFTTIIAIVMGLLTCFAIYSVFQTAVPRPVIVSQDFFSRLTRIIYHFDAPYNGFPSIHVMTSFIVFLGSERAKTFSRKIPFLAQGMAVLVIISTLFLKQHTLLDVAGGLILGKILFTLGFKAVCLAKQAAAGADGRVGEGDELAGSIAANGLTKIYIIVPAIFYILKEMSISYVVKLFHSNQL